MTCASGKSSDPSARLPPPRRYLALYLPWLAEEGAVLRGLAPPDSCFALVGKDRGGLRIAALSRAAAELGLEPGLTLAEARARLPDLAGIPHDPAADAGLLRWLARRCVAFTPSASPDPPWGLMLDITGCAHLFGGEAGLRDAVLLALEEEGVTAQAAIAITPDAARALAKAGRCDEDVGALPVEALPVEVESLIALRRAGLRRISDLAALPRSALAARFGSAMTQALAWLCGEEDRRTAPEPPLEPVAAIRRFAEPVVDGGAVLAAVEGLLSTVAGDLARRGQGGRAFLLLLDRSDGHVARLMVRTGAPTRDPALVLRLLVERIDSLADPLDPGFGYDAITLRVPGCDPLEEEQAGFASRPARAPLGPLLDRLAVRHGADAVLEFAQDDSHVPERAGGLRRWAGRQLSGNGRDRDKTCDGLLPRPLTLFDPPEPVEVLAEIPDAPPRRFVWRGKAHRVVAQEGPERIAPEWWRRRGGHGPSPGLSRDYYRVEDEEGGRFWLFRHGLYEGETQAPRWYVHGLFA